MCYETAQLAYKIYKEAKRLNASDEEVEELHDKWKKLKGDAASYYHVSGFDHPKLTSFTRENGQLEVNQRTWGLIPHWVKDEEFANSLWNRTLLSRAESMHEKPSFRDALTKNRCIVPLDGFYEHFHKNGKTFPHFIQSQDSKRLFVGGLTSKWLNKETGVLMETLSLVTTKANDVMAKIHNNPKLKEGRMPLILSDDDASIWLNDNADITRMLIPNTSVPLKSWTVNRLKGKNYVGNVIEVQKERVYVELNDPLTLF